MKVLHLRNGDEGTDFFRNREVLLKKVLPHTQIEIVDDKIPATMREMQSLIDAHQPTFIVVDGNLPDPVTYAYMAHGGVLAHEPKLPELREVWYDGGGIFWRFTRLRLGVVRQEEPATFTLPLPN